MTNEEVIKQLEITKQCDVDTVAQIKALNIAIVALRNYPISEPLTLEQLRDMDDQPVKVKTLEYEEGSLSTGVVSMCDPNDSDNGVYVGCSFHCIQDYGRAWIAYSYHSSHIGQNELRCTGCDYLDRNNAPCAHCVRAAGYADYYNPVD